jgi:hypothetical protein
LETDFKKDRLLRLFICKSSHRVGASDERADRARLQKKFARLSMVGVKVATLKRQKSREFRL